MKAKLIKSLWLLNDTILIAASLYFSFILRFSFNIPSKYAILIIQILPIVVVFKVCIFYLFGFHKQIWRHSSLAEINRLVKGVSLSSLGIISVLYIVQTNPALPRLIFIIDWLLTFVLIGGSRLIVRWYEDWRVQKSSLSIASSEGKRVLIVGAGEAGSIIAKKMQKYSNSGNYPVAFLDDNEKKHNCYISGIPVVGNINSLKQIISEYKIDEVVIALPSVSGDVRSKIVFECERLKVRCKTVPSVLELIHGAFELSQIRDVQVEDILGRDVVSIDLKKMSSHISGKKVLITGAAGSIGSELCKQAALLGASQIIALDINEGGIFNLSQNLEYLTDIDIKYRVCDCRDSVFVEKIFSEYSPQIVYHAAAYKHVYLMESHSLEAMSNNLFGTKTVADIAAKLEVDEFVLISTDKAVNAANIMGISKSLAEKYIKIISKDKSNVSDTKFVIVRFGNVLDSNGSVVPLFKKQIANREPITITHPEMTRYFMTIPEATQLVIQASAMGSDNEIFVLNMGEPVSIVELAENIIRLSGFEPNKDIPINYIGVRPGEKIHEQLFDENEKEIATSNKQIFIAQSEITHDYWKDIIGKIQTIIANGNSQTLIELFREIFTHYDLKINKENANNGNVINFEEVKSNL